MSTLAVVCKIGERLPIYQKYARNLGQSDFDLLADYTQAEIVIIPTISSKLFGCQDDAVMQPARQSPEQLSYYRNVSFGYLYPPNHESSACSIDVIVQNN